MTEQPGESVKRATKVSHEAKALSEAQLSRTHPSDIPPLAHEIAATLDSLKQVTAQLSWWHSRAVNGSDYAPDEGANLGIEDAAAQLLAASRFVSAARDAVAAAETATRTVRWKRRH
ncbi:hypothetical protein [Brevibacterium linens]|uniref:Uncharacterized protein n=1 Tax=Brevibacterium linens TaxID=1703 RepID=A0A2H1KGL6_BRELN|nr:hypothetical protein [Brevibacterium linens]SMX98870.1 hypothetical protein BLIN101_03330 [Brevibacterium linens]